MKPACAALLILTVPFLTGHGAVAQPMPVAPLIHARDTEPKPPDTDPAAQAAWWVRHYDNEIEADTRNAEGQARDFERDRGRLAHFKPSDADNPDRLQVLAAMDTASSVKALSELHAQAAADAKAAVLKAEAVRLAVAAGTRPASDLLAAQASAVQAERLVQAAQKARLDRTMAHVQASAILPVPPVRPPIGSQLGDLLAAQERARLEGVAYNEVRTAVEAGKRPAADLEAARASLKAAQIVVYDQIDALMKSNIATMERLREDTARRIETQEARVADEEKELPTLAGDQRTRAEDRLRMNREVLESYRRTAALAMRLPTPRPRPELPVLPPRS